MAFKSGSFVMSPIELATCGLLSVARVETWDEGDEPWLRGYDFDVMSTPAVDILNFNNVHNPVTNGEVSAGDPIQFHTGEGFIINVEKTSSGMGIVGGDLEEGAISELRSATQKAVEYEFWTGVSIVEAGTDSIFLSKAGGATDTTGGGKPAAIALRYLEQAISTSPTGARGVIHMTRDVASELGSRLLYKGRGDNANTDRAITRLGTRVVIGSGYTGSGPIGATGAAPSATNKWMYATSEVEVELGAVEVVSGSREAFNTSTNDALVVVQRAAAAHFDPSIWAAAQVTLPTS